MSLNHFVDEKVDKPWMNIGCNNLTVYGSANIPIVNTNQIELKDGTVGAPSLTFQNQLNTGLYRVGASEVAVSCNGVQILDVNQGSVKINASNTFNNNPLLCRLNLGQGQDVGNTIASFYGSGERITVIDQNIGTSEGPQITFGAGLGGIISTAPGSGDLNLRSNNGTNCAVITNNSVQLKDGVVGTPALTFQSNTNTGIYRKASNDLSITVGGLDGLEVKKVGSLASVVACTQGIIPANSTDGFLYAPIILGPPVGVPTSAGGNVPICFDFNSLKLWAYISGAWKSVTFS
jgi:hypothetical protein